MISSVSLLYSITNSSFPQSYNWIRIGQRSRKPSRNLVTFFLTALVFLELLCYYLLNVPIWKLQSQGYMVSVFELYSSNRLQSYIVGSQNGTSTIQCTICMAEKGSFPSSSTTCPIILVVTDYWFYYNRENSLHNFQCIRDSNKVFYNDPQFG